MSAFLFKSLSVLFFVLMGTCIKLLADRIPLFEVVFFRNFFALFPVLFMLWKYNLKLSEINQYHLHLMRAAFGICAMTLFFLSLRHVHLVEMQTLSFSSVFFISILSVFFLHEVIGKKRIIAIMFGFIAQVFLTKSYQLADASLLAPFEFSSLLWSYFIGYFLFNEVVSLRVYIGGLLVVLSVSYIFYRERTLKKKVVLGVNKQF